MLPWRYWQVKLRGEDLYLPKLRKLCTHVWFHTIPKCAIINAYVPGDDPTKYLSCSATPAPSPPSNCVSSAYKGDSYCDDANNNEGCDYDGGDCCGENVKTDFCSACECKDPAMAPCEK